MHTKNGEGRDTTAEWRADFAAQVASIISALSDTDLVGAYGRIGRETGNPEADTLLAEINRRGLNT